MLSMTSFLLFDLFFWTYVALLLAAAAFDVGRFVIPNWISVALVALFGLALLAHPVSPDWLSHLGATGLVLAVMLVAYRFGVVGGGDRSEEHTSELQSLMRISYAVFCLKKKKK